MGKCAAHLFHRPGVGVFPYTILPPDWQNQWVPSVLPEEFSTRLWDARQVWLCDPARIRVRALTDEALAQATGSSPKHVEAALNSLRWSGSRRERGLARDALYAWIDAGGDLIELKRRLRGRGSRA